MVLTFDGWILDVDIEKTMAYCRQISLDYCQCGYCRNYRTAVDQIHPDLRMFLARLGRSMETPDELMPFEPTLYEATYCICGKILQKGEEWIRLNSMDLRLLEQSELDFDTECPGPCFALVTPLIQLPWVLDEDMDEVISPANEAEYLQRMWNKLLQKAPEENTYS